MEEHLVGSSVDFGMTAVTVRSPEEFEDIKRGLCENGEDVWPLKIKMCCGESYTYESVLDFPAYGVDVPCRCGRLHHLVWGFEEKHDGVVE